MKVVLLLSLVALTQGYPDFFTFGETDEANDTFGPADWDLVRCRNVKDCPGWPTNWDDISKFVPYNTGSNSCLDCSELDDGICFKHNQSPIALVQEITEITECNDRHRMRYWKGECRFQNMNFEVLPHVLRASQPKNGCKEGKFQPQIDFSRGFPEPWLLSHTDIAVPSHHTMNGKHYDAEVMLTHSYSTNKENKEIGIVSILLEKGDAGDRYDFLDLYLNRWMEEANEVHKNCFGENKARMLKAQLDDANRDLEEESVNKKDRRLEEEFELHDPVHPDDNSEPLSYTKDEDFARGEWHPYDFYAKANTEYYYRYQGSLPEPPCVQLTHWRVLKDTVVVAPSQLRVMHELIKSRVDPDTCEFNTAAKLKKNPDAAKIEVNRPLQTTTVRHKLFFCACDDWDSKSEKDLEYCKQEAKNSKNKL